MTSKLWLWPGRTAFLAILAAAAFWTACRAADKDDDAPQSPANEQSVVPADAAAVVTFHIAELWDNKDFKTTLEKIVIAHPDALEGMDKDLGVAPQDIENIAVVQLEAAFRVSLLSVVTTRKPFDAKKVAALLAPRAREEKIKGHTYLNNPNKHSFNDPNGDSVVILGDRTYATGPADEIKNYLRHMPAAKEGPLTPALRAAGKHWVAIGVNFPLLAEKTPIEMVWPLLQPQLKAKTALVTVDLGKDLKVEGMLTFASEADARASKGAIDWTCALTNVGLDAWKKEKDWEKWVSTLQEIQTGLENAKIARDGSSVTASMTFKVDLAGWAAELAEVVEKDRQSAPRMKSVNSLKQLALAMHKYNDVYGHFPANAIYDKNGKPLLSWRVMVLPYIEQNELYKQFHLDEPWDSENNKKLLDKMPPLFASPNDAALTPRETHYQTLVGKGAVFDGEKGVMVTDIADGTSNTIMLVEAKKAVPWTKPEDVPFDGGKLLPKLGGLFDGIFNAAFADGSVHTIQLTIPEEKLRALITINGGEVIPADK